MTRRRKDEMLDVRASYGTKQTKTNLLPVVSDPSHIHRLFLLFLQEPGEIYPRDTKNHQSLSHGNRSKN